RGRPSRRASTPPIDPQRVEPRDHANHLSETEGTPPPMTMTPEQAHWFAETFDKLVQSVGQAVLGKNEVVRLVLTSMMAPGHVLGDVPNRASPEAQAAMLEVMEEGRVTVDGVTHEVGNPFMVIATQNPIEQAGTYRLPEAQLDRFLMKTSIGYPDHASSVQILQGSAVRDRSSQLTPRISLQAVNDMTQLAATVHVDPAVLEYVSRLMEETRLAPEVRVGVSIRGALALMRTVKVWAAVNGRHYVIPDDVKQLVEPVWLHRFVLDPEAEFAGTTAKSVM